MNILKYITLDPSSVALGLSFLLSCGRRDGVNAGLQRCADGAGVGVIGEFAEQVVDSNNHSANCI